MLCGCGARSPVDPARVVPDPHASGNNQFGLHGEVLAKPLRVIVEGDVRPGLLGGKGSRPHAAGVPVTFSVADPTTGAVFEESGVPSLEVVTDAGGTAAAELRLGNHCGDVEVTASVETSKGTESTSFRVLSGIECIGQDLEAAAGGTLDRFGVRLEDALGKPAEGVEVFFHAIGYEGGAVGDEVVKTNAEGEAATSWKLGKGTGQYLASVEIRDRRPDVPASDRFDARVIEFEAMGLDRRKLLMELAGGLAVFILGMRWMSGGLRRMADRRLKSILRAMTRNRFMATGVGATITAMIQSSSATTVLTVGFVNAGLLTLPQAIGVVYGANIGTTITAQIIAFKLNALAYPAIALGLALSVLARRPWLKALGEAILGFGLLFLGMTTMSGVLKPLRHSPSFQAWFQLFDCTPLNGGGVQAGPALMCILIGTITTCVIQSSSATVGLVLALSSQGLLSFYTAVPLVLGDNIGTTITAVLASLGANRNAKRTAIAHTMFNVLGATYMYLLLLVPLWKGQPVFLGLVDALTPGEVFGPSPENLTRHVANAHTTFNILNCLLFLPFVNTMARICQAIVPVTDADRETVLQYLEPRLLKSPSLALEQAVREVAYMLRRAQKSLQDGCAFFLGGPRELAERVKEREVLIDRLQHEITSYLVELSRTSLEPHEAMLIPALIHAVNDAERIGDHSEDLVELGHLRREHKYKFSGWAKKEIKAFLGILDAQFETIYGIFRRDAEATVDKVLAREEEATELFGAAAEDHVTRLETKDCEVQAGVVFLDFMGHLERIGDHLVNIAERAGRVSETMPN